MESQTKIKEEILEDVFDQLNQDIRAKLDEMVNQKTFQSIFKNESEFDENDHIKRVIMKLYCDEVDKLGNEDWDKPFLPDNESTKCWLDSVVFKYMKHKSDQEETTDYQDTDEEMDHLPIDVGKLILEKEEEDYENDIDHDLKELLYLLWTELISDVERRKNMEDAEIYLQIAKSDLKSANIHLPEELWPQSVNAAQQAAEKSLKALLVCKEGLNSSWMQTHKIDYLASLVNKKWSFQMELDFLSRDLESLGNEMWLYNQNASLIVRARYADNKERRHLDYSTMPHLVFSSDKADRAYFTAFRINSIAESMLKIEREKENQRVEYVCCLLSAISKLPKQEVVQCLQSINVTIDLFLVFAYIYLFGVRI